MKRQKRILRVLGLFIVSFVLMLVCSGFTSPLYPHYIGLDTAVFFTVARGFVNGKIPYADLFDHKGPIFYLMYSVGYFIDGRTGVFLLQCVLLFADLLLIRRIAVLFHAEMHALMIPFMAFFCYMFEHGGLTEEFSMPFILAGMYLELRFLVSGKEKHAPGVAFLYGIVLAALAFIRLNNAVVVCALLLAIMIILVSKKQWTNLLVNLICGLAGIVVVACPVFLYYYSRNAMNDMIYGAFLHNLIYAKNNTHYPILSSSLPYFLILFLPGLYAIGIFWKKWRTERKREYGALLFAAVLTYAMLTYTNIYLHYFMLGIPIVITAVAAEGGRPYEVVRKKMTGMLSEKGGFKGLQTGFAALVLTGITAIYLLLAGLSACAPIYKTYLTDIAESEYEQVQEGTSIIPEEERDSVIAYNALANYYYHADIIPCYKYFTLQKWMTTEKVNVNQEFICFLEEKHPLWVVLPVEEESEKIRSILEDDYVCRRTDEKYAYYRCHLNEAD